MTTIKLFTRDQEIFASKNPVVTTGNKGTVSLMVDFDSMWDGFNKSAVFRIENDGNPTEVPFIDGKCSVPRIEKKCNLYIGVKGTKVDGTTKVSKFIKYKIEEGANGVYSYDPTDQVYQKILSAYNIIESRFNNLAKLEVGSTTGDAELIDVRVGSNGKVYANAGEAIRGQVSELKSDLIQFNTVSEIDKNNIEWTFGGIDAMDGSENTSRIHICTVNKYLINPKTNISFTGLKVSNTGISRKHFAYFYDKNEQYIKRNSDIPYNIPENACYVRFTYSNYSESGIFIETTEQLKEMASDWNISFKNVIRQELDILESISNYSLLPRKIVNQENVDFNDMLKGGIYRFSKDMATLAKNIPCSTGGDLIVIPSNTSELLVGTVHFYITVGNRFFYRYATSNNWNDWDEIKSNKYNSDIRYSLYPIETGKLINAYKNAFIDWETVSNKMLNIKSVDTNGNYRTYSENQPLEGIPYSSTYRTGGDVFVNRNLSTFYSAICNP